MAGATTTKNQAAKRVETSLTHGLAGATNLPISDPEEDEDRAEALLALSIALVDSALDLLHDHIKKDEQLAKSSKLMPGGSLGKHFRHVSHPLD